ncbi:MAG: DUF333 domain-containing protein [Chloroflexota bacterium]
MSRSMRAALLGAGSVLLLGSSALAQSPAPSPWPGPDFQFDQAAAEQQCTAAGGTVQERRAAFNTNMDPDAWVMFAGDIDLCRFQTLGADDDSRIYVDLVTLSATVPTLAATAYLSNVPMGDSVNGNPATLYCTSLGGSSSFGSGASGGGWVNLTDPIDQVVSMCVFEDGSMIDEWGLAYHSQGTVRGIDLAPVFAWQPGKEIPAVY